ncbi:MAG: alpha/beta fold hydrolase [Pseudomonadota bacterium]
MIRVALLVAALGLPVEAASRDVAIVGDGVTRACTLLKPDGVANPPAVILVSGSGPQDRDETIRGSKPFLRIATHLAREGIASLRCDDRGVGGSTGSKDATLAEEAGDLRRALAFLCGTDGLDHRRIGVLGHSMGGVVLSLAAAETHPAFAVLLAAPAVKIGDLLRMQTATRLKLNGVPASRIEINDQVIAALTQASLYGDATLRVEAERLARDLGGNETWVDQKVVFFGSRMFRSFLDHDMAAYRDLSMPALALFGGTDWKVDAGTNADALRALALPALTVITLDDHNHLFQRTAEGRPLSATGPAPSTETLDQLSAWITATPPAKPCEDVR